MHSYRRNSDGSIDFAFYRKRGADLRAQAIREIGRALCRNGKIAIVSIFAMIGAAFSTTLEWMFLNEFRRLGPGHSPATLRGAPERVASVSGGIRL